MKRIAVIVAAMSCIVPLCAANRSNSVEIWGQYEIELKGTPVDNPFTRTKISAVFSHKDTTVTVNGFYDGNDTYRIRFMPMKTGEWKYAVASNNRTLNGHKGSFGAIAATPGNHGPVRVRGVRDFEYADGKPYFPFGTTAYAWTHMDPAVQQQTLNSLAGSEFNKLRMCVFPKNYDLVKEEPALFPFVIKSQNTDKDGQKHFEWDFERFDPAFFRHLEQRITDLQNLGIEADVIIFHPYDKGRWGFDAMSNDVNLRYIEYLTARIASFRNVWWSMANEYDYVAAKTDADWDMLTKAVIKNDPYRHLCSIHGSTARYYDYTKPELTHTSIQDEGPVSGMGRASIVRNIYSKPIIFDEVCYEGNLRSRWGRLSGEEMLHYIWNGLVAGTYVTHGECYAHNDTPYDTIFWAKGGEFRGSSWKRIGFTRSIIEAAPAPLQMADVSRDDRTATAGEGYYIVYFGREMLDAWQFNLPVKNAGYQKLTEGRKFRVEIIDTWDMTITEYPQIFETAPANDYRILDKNLGKVRLPLKPYIALRITEITDR